MTKEREALKLALEALESVEGVGTVIQWKGQWELCHAAINAIQEALAQSEQEPAAWHTEDHLTDRSATTYRKDMMYSWECKGWPVTPLYTSPPKREWVGLTLTDREQLRDKFEDWNYPAILIDAIADKLKELNHD